MKKILLLIAVAFMFAACNKCKECTHDDWEYTTYDNNGDMETHGDQIMEVCSDNFESKADFKSYIEAMEDDDWECKSDFWN
jgi:hypothetical protein